MNFLNFLFFFQDFHEKTAALLSSAGLFVFFFLIFESRAIKQDRHHPHQQSRASSHSKHERHPGRPQRNCPRPSRFLQSGDSSDGRTAGPVRTKLPGFSRGSTCVDVASITEATDSISLTNTKHRGRRQLLNARVGFWTPVLRAWGSGTAAAAAAATTADGDEGEDQVHTSSNIFKCCT